MNMNSIHLLIMLQEIYVAFPEHSTAIMKTLSFYLHQPVSNTRWKIAGIALLKLLLLRPTA